MREKEATNCPPKDGLNHQENITGNDDFSDDKKSAHISDYPEEDYSPSNPKHLSNYEIGCLIEESDDNANQIANTGFSGSESTVNGVCEEAMVREENKKLNDSYCPDENDPSILSQFFDDDGWNFHRHFMQKPNSRKRRYVNVFTAEGFCIFDDCDCKFNLVMKKHDLEEKILTVTYSGSIKHAAGERHSRFIKGNERNELKKLFHKGPDKPSMVYQAKKAELSGDAMASGNRTDCGVQRTTMRKIASEGRQLSQMDNDMTKSLEKIRQKLIEKESSRECPPNPGHGGFVHTICFHPLIVHMWIEDQVRL